VRKFLAQYWFWLLAPPALIFAIWWLTQVLSGESAPLHQYPLF